MMINFLMKPRRHCAGDGGGDEIDLTAADLYFMNSVCVSVCHEKSSLSTSDVSAGGAK